MVNYVDLKQKTKLRLSNFFHVPYDNTAKSDSQNFDISSCGVWSTLAGLESHNYTERSNLSWGLFRLSIDPAAKLMAKRIARLIARLTNTAKHWKKGARHYITNREYRRHGPIASPKQAMARLAAYPGTPYCC